VQDIDIEKAEISPAAVKRVPAAVANVYKVVPVRIEGNVLTVAVADPWNLKALEDLSRMFGVEVRGLAAQEDAVLRVLERLYGGPGRTVEDLYFEIDGVDPGMTPPGVA
jgi:type IV pilus assembly protein PilB